MIEQSSRPQTEHPRSPRTLLITSTRPGVGSVGELFLGALCKLFQHDKLFCFAAVGPDYEVPVCDDQLSWLPITERQLPKEYHWQYRENFFTSSLRKFRHLEMLEKSLEPIIQDVLKLIADQKIELLWFVLNSPSMVHIANRILMCTKIPSMGIVWDPLHSITEHGKMDERSRSKLDKQSDYVISKLDACGVASYGMQTYFAKKRADLPTRVLIRPSEISPVASIRDKSKVVITFAGSLYAQTEFLALVAALNRLGWQLDGKEIELNVFSSNFNMPISSGNKRTRLMFGGYLAEGDLAIELAKSDIAYLPYWFAKEHSEAVARCFPAKLATYVAAGCPVLFHGPKNSSPVSFLNQFKVGVGVHSADPTAIEKAMRQLAFNEAFKEAYAEERRRALTEEIGIEIFEKRFLELLAFASAHREKK